MLFVITLWMQLIFDANFLSLIHRKFTFNRKERKENTQRTPEKF